MPRIATSDLETLRHEKKVVWPTPDTKFNFARFLQGRELTGKNLGPPGAGYLSFHIYNINWKKDTEKFLKSYRETQRQTRNRQARERRARLKKERLAKENRPMTAPWEKGRRPAIKTRPKRITLKKKPVVKESSKALPVGEERVGIGSWTREISETEF